MSISLDKTTCPNCGNALIKNMGSFSMTIFFETMFGSLFYMIYNIFIFLFVKAKFRIEMRRDKVLKEFSLRLAEKK